MCRWSYHRMQYGMVCLLHNFLLLSFGNKNLPRCTNHVEVNKIQLAFHCCCILCLFKLDFLHYIDNYVKVDRSQNGELRANQTCIQCKEDTHPDMTGTQCVRCHQTYIDITGSCDCPEPNQEVGTRYCYFKFKNRCIILNLIFLSLRM